IYSLLVLAVFGLKASAILWAQDSESTPSQRTKEAVDKFNKAPAAIGQSLQELRDSAKEKLRQTLGGKAKSETKTKTESKLERVDLDVPQKAPAEAKPAALKPNSRDPFRPMTMRTRVNTRVARENLSPLERLDLGQLKVVGIVWDIKEPRAMVEDSAGLGYVVKVGTPIGNNDGAVKAIHRNQIVVEEPFDDIYGVRKMRDVALKLPGEP
ncbi:MAG TPA: pilus assembly protein PilP, partial [Candidatus Binatus sp.]|nr:pilus assembly protein PilP [Candidatus Binatus sp.]